MGENEQTNKTNPLGKEANQALAPDGEPLSDYDKALALVKRREEATKAEKEVLEEKKKLAANTMLSGSAGGAVEQKLVSEEDKKTAGALEYWKGTQLERDIMKANKKDNE